MGPHQFAQHVRLGGIRDRDIFLLVIFNHVRQNIQVCLRPRVQMLLQKPINDQLRLNQVLVVADLR
jgi:hypothetical protein